MNSITKKTILIISVSIFVSCYQMPGEKEPPKTEDTGYQFYSMAYASYQAGEYDKALEQIDKAIRLNRYIAKFFHLKGDIFIAKKDPDKALTAYEQAVSMRSFSPEILEKMAQIYIEKGKFADAIQSKKKVLVNRPEKYDQYLDIAELYLKLNQSDFAMNSAGLYKKEITEKKLILSGRYFQIMGRIYYAKIDYENAIDFYSKAVQAGYSVEPGDNKKYMFSYFGLKQYEKAYNYLLRLKPENLPEADIHLFRGLYYYNIQNYKDAQTQLELALQKKTEINKVYLYLAKTYLKIGKTADSEAMIDAYKKISGSDSWNDEFSVNI
ncbi:MAG: tetratricopeptide repeat protein [Calditrichaceae bacterium]